MKELLVLKAPLSGVISGAPSIDEVNMGFEKGKPFCTITAPRRLRVTLPVVTSEYNQLRQNLLGRLPPARLPGQHLSLKVSVNYAARRSKKC